MRLSDSAMTRRHVLALTGGAVVAGCTSGDDSPEAPDPVEDDYSHVTPTGDPGWEPPTDSPLDADLQVETLVENLEIPWDITFADGRLFLTERTGSVLQFDSGNVAEVTSPTNAIDAGSVDPGTDDQPWWVEGGEGGTLGIAAHPSYPDEQYVYVYYTAEDPLRNRVVRYDVSASEPAETEEVIVDEIPADNIHNGGRITFGPDDNLWIGTGDAGDGSRSRDPSSLAGKVLRVSPAGEPLETNPNLNGDPRIFTYGHRNVQGIDWTPDGVPIVTEHGPTGRDEIQLLRPGGDYGWNDIRGGPDTDGYESYANHTDVVPPLVNTGSAMSWAPTGATFYTGEDVPALQNRYLVGGLGSQALYAVTLSPPDSELPPPDGDWWRFDEDWLDNTYTATAHRLLEDELGRIRHVTQSPEGDLYAITSNRDGRASGSFPRDNDDVLVRLTTA